MPQCDFDTIVSGDADAAKAIQMRHQLLSGWVVLPADIVFIEFQDSAARNRVDPGTHSFVITKSVTRLVWFHRALTTD